MLAITVFLMIRGGGAASLDRILSSAKEGTARGVQVA